MSDWSSYSDDKARTDKWREYLTESPRKDEGLGDAIKKLNPFNRLRSTAGIEDEEVPEAAPEDPSEPDDEPTPVEPQELPDIKISTSSRYGKATTIEDIALQALGMETLPDPNTEKNANRALSKLTAKIAQTIRGALQQAYPAQIGNISISENKDLEITTIHEWPKVLNEKK